MAFSRCLSLVLTMLTVMSGLHHISGEKTVALNAVTNKLKFEKNGLLAQSFYYPAVDGKIGQTWGDCAVSQSSTPTVWLSIDLLHLYSVTKIRFLTRNKYGIGIEVWVGKSSIKSNGTSDYQCGRGVAIPYPAPSTFTDFPCSPINWVQYVSIRRHGQDDGKGDPQYLQPCEIEVYYDETEDPGVTITKNAMPISKLDVTKGDIVLCGSSKGDFGPTWKFPNGTDVPEQNSATISQADGSSGYKELHLSPLTSTPPNGQYKCQYTANNITKTKTVDLTFTVDCQVSSWSACSSSCGRGTRTRTITRNKVGAGQDCPSPLSEHCANTNCGQIDMTAIGAVATHGPLATIDSRFRASLAIDGVTNTGYAITLASMKPWLRVDLKTAYLIRSVETSFYQDRGNGAFVRIGSDLTNDGNNNPLCGTVPNRDNSNTIWTATIVCSPSLWGRYINVQKFFPNNFYLSLGELRASYELDVGILYNDTSVLSGDVFVYGGDALAFPVLCGVNPDSTNLNSLLNIQLKSGNSPISSSNSDDVSQSTVSNLRSLHINKAPLTDTSYTCQFTWIDMTPKTLQFNLNINVDCGWSTWSSVCSGSCGVGTRLRTADNPVQKHQGKNCTGPSSEDCDTGQAPCAPTPVRNSISVQEGLPAALECEATQFRLIQTPITFEWFKNGVQIVNPSNSSTRSLGDGKYRGTLTLTSVRKADAVSYTCRASGNSGLSAASLPITLDVTYAPFNVRVKANSGLFVKDQLLTLNCSAEANPKPSQYKWYKDGQIMTGKTSQRLSFQNLDYDNNGVYNCTARNSVGEAQSSGFVIVVDGPPGMCSRPSGTSSVGDSVEVSVSNCPINGNADVTKYKIFYKTLGSSNPWSEVVEMSLPVNIAGLAPYTEYEVRVAAGNQHGYGPNSNPRIIRTTQGEPGPPGNVSAISLGPRRVGVTWSKPINPFGPINDYRIFYSASKIVRREVANNEDFIIVAASRKEANLTGLAPYTYYSIEMAAINIRDGDNKILLGTRSNEVIVQTGEDAPSAPRNLISTPLTPNSVKIQWSPPDPANGRIRNYMLVYTKTGEKTGNKTITVSGGSLFVDLDNLDTAVKYNVWIRAVTVSPGPYKSITVDTNPKTPDPPSALQVVGRTSSSLFLTWKPPTKPNGVIQNYNVYYWRLGDKPQQKSVDDGILFLNLAELRAYTNYTINMTAVNNAEDSIKEGPAATVQAQTLIAAPERPAVDGTTPLVSVEDGTVTLSAPSISDEKVPISYVQVFVYSGPRPSPPSVPQDVIDGATSDSWRVADRYTYELYRQRQTIVVDGVEAGAQYSIYFVAYTEDDQGGVLASSSKPLSVSSCGPTGECEAATSNPSGDSSIGTVGIAFLILFVITFIALVVLFMVYFLQRQIWKKSYSMEKNVYELPMKSAAKLEGDIMPHRMTESSVYGTSSVKHQSEEVYAEICDKEKETNK